MLLPLLADGVKGFFENPELLIGIPLLAIGVLGVALVLAPIELRWPRVTAIERGELLPEHSDHPSAAVYVQVGIVLAIVTAIEVAFYYIELAEGALLAVLLVLSLLKFVLVGLWFMHLRFDNSLFTILFTGGLLLAIALFMVVLSTLGANLV